MSSTTRGEEVYDKVPDPNGSGRYVSVKPSNKAFLKSKAKRDAHHVRASRSASSSNISGWTILLILIFLPLLSSFTTNTYTFTLGDRYLPRLRKWVAVNPLNPFRTELRVFSPEELSKFDGRDRWLPVYVGIKGEVYDVSKNRRVYGYGGSYNMMAGRDASRSFVTGCFQTHLTHDLRGFDEKQLNSLETWRKFFADHAEYRLVGRVDNPPIDPASPIPPDCHEVQTSASGSPPVHAHPAVGPLPAPAPVRKHEEL